MTGQEKFAAARRVCVVGNLNIDLIVRGVPELPAWGQEVAGTSHVAASSGQAGYLAMALGRFGVPVSVVANVGDDAFGRQILGDLERHEVDIGAVETDPGATGITVGIVRPDGERAFVSDFACLHAFDEALVLRHWDRIAAADVVCLVGQFCLSAITPEVATRLLARARAEGKLTVLDTGWDPAGWPPDTIRGVRRLLGEVDLFLPNLDEARALTGRETPDAAAEVLAADGPEIVVVKSGAAGSFVRVDGATHALPALPTEVRDAVGAGDTFDAGFVYGLLQGWPLAACLAFGNAAAAIYVSRLTDRFPSATETAAAADRYRSQAASVSTREKGSIS
ncbi:MAG: carbohydrate kinase family protein [Thermomicrobiales bacterium]|nr:carbohydrate kinase family protein [Thermomicrobiales bacterium]